MVTLMILVRGIIQIFPGAIKETISGDHRHDQDLEGKTYNHLNLSLTKTKVHPLEVQWKAKWRNSWI